MIITRGNQIHGRPSIDLNISSEPNQPIRTHYSYDVRINDHLRPMRVEEQRMHDVQSVKHNLFHFSAFQASNNSIFSETFLCYWFRLYRYNTVTQQLGQSGLIKYNHKKQKNLNICLFIDYFLKRFFDIFIIIIIGVVIFFIVFFYCFSYP